MIFFLVFLFFVGLIFGSFISALSWRIPKDISIAKGRSICPNCKHQIAWYDNIPLISYLILGGHCRNCKTHISLRYPIIELSSGIGFVLVYYFFSLQGLSSQAVYSITHIIFTLVIFVILLTIFVIDLEHQIIPDSLVFTGIVLTLVYYMVSGTFSSVSALLSGFVAASFLLTIYLLTKGRGMGLGDVKFAILGGMLVGLKMLPVWLLLSFLTGAVAGIILILIGKARMQTKIAFGPFLIIGITLAFVFGHSLTQLIGLV